MSLVMYRHAHLKKSRAFVNIIFDIRFESMHVYASTCAYLCCLRISECVSVNTEVDLESTTETKGHKPSENSFG